LEAYQHGAIDLLIKMLANNKEATQIVVSLLPGPIDCFFSVKAGELAIVFHGNE